MSEVRIVKNTARDEYEIWVDEVRAGLITYRDRPNGVVLPHTEVSPEFGGQGLATKLAKFALDDVRAQGKYVLPYCPFIARYVTEHPEEQDLVEPEFKALMGL